MILVALGVDLEGNKEIIAMRACAEESKDGWMCVLQDLRTRSCPTGRSDSFGWT
jgi:putative transposase